MNIVDIFKGFEKLIVQLLLLIIYLPKTIVKIIKDPQWVPDYVDEESQKTDGFKDYVSPVMLYLIITVLLIIAIRMLWGIEEANLSIESSDNDIFKRISKTLQGSIGVTIAIVSMGIPLYCALLIEFFNRNNFSRDNLVKVLYIQCYYFSPLILALLGFFMVMTLLEDSVRNLNETIVFIYSFPINIIFLITLVWFLINQVKFISDETKNGKWKSISLIGLGIGIIYISIIIYNWFTPATIIDNKPAGQAESIEFKVSDKGNFKIQVLFNSKSSEDLIGEYELSMATKRASTMCPVYYPFNGYLDHNQKVLGSVFSQSNMDELCSVLSNENLPPLNRASWVFTGNTGENLIFFTNPYETSGNLLFNVADSLGKEIVKNHKSPDSMMFSPPYDGVFKLIISWNNPSEETKNYQLALLEENTYLYGSKWKEQPLGNVPPKTISIPLKEYINDSISYPNEGTISIGQKIRAPLNKFGGFYNQKRQWQFLGSYFEDYKVTVIPIGNNKEAFDLKLDVLDDSNNSIFKFARLPFLIIALLMLIFGFAFVQGFIGFVKKKSSN